MEFLDLVKSRYSCREFEDREIDQDILDEILAIGGNAPVGRGDYDSLNFTLVHSPEVLAIIRKHSAKTGVDRSFSAPYLIVVSVNNLEDPLALQNVGCVIDHMALAASDFGLGNCYLYGFIRDMVKDKYSGLAALELPEGYVPVAALGFGHPAQTQEPKSDLVSKIKINHV